MVLQFIQLVQPVDRVSAQVVVLWLLLLEALTAPHVLWVLSRRYRHALVYVWTVHVLRDTSAKEEDPSACTLQSYTRRVQAPGGATVRVTARVRRGVTITGPVHEYQPNGQVRAYSREDDPEGFSPDYTGAARRGAEIITTDLDDDLTVITDIASTKKRYIYHSPASERAAQASLQRPEAAEGSGGSSQTTSPSRLSVNSPTRPFDMRRSGSAREAWKEQMRKKHLPAVFVNDAFDAEEEGERGQDLVSDMHVLPDVALVGGDFDEVDSEAENVVVNETLRKTSGRRPPHHVINHHFHYDYQRSDGAPRVESESDGSSFQYDDRDIEIILDGHHGLHSGGSRSVLEKVVEAEAPRESNDDPVPHFAATTEGVLKDGYLGRVDSYGDSSEGSSTEKQSVRGRKKPPRRSSRTNRLKDQPSFVVEGEHDLEDRSDGTEEARAWTLQGEGLKQGADEFVGREFFLYEADQSKQMPAYEMQNDFNQYSSSVELDKEGFRKNFSRVPESVNPGLVSVAFSKNDFVKLQNITSDSTDADNIPDNVSVTSTVKVSGDKNSSNKANKVLLKDVFKDEFDEVAPHNPRKRTEVMDKDFDDVDEPRGTPTGNSVISAPWTPYAGGGSIKNGSHPSSRTRSSYFRRDVDSSKQMITMVDSDADLPDTAIVLDVLETSSSGSEHSVVLEPYHRRPLWLDDDDEQSQSNSAADLSISNPFRVSSVGYPFADPSREGQFKSQGLSSGLGNSFGGSFDAKGKKSYDLVNPFPNEVLETTSSSGAYSHDTFSSESDTAQSSGSSDQLSFLRDATSERLGVNGFDDEADRYHDNTMAIDYNIMIHPYYGSYPGLYFESIKEEPEDLSDSTLSGHTEDDAHGSTHGTLQSFSAESFGPSKTKPFLLNGDSTFQVQAISQTVNKDVAPPGRTSADGREAPTPDICSTQRTGTLEPEDLPYWDDGAVSISTKQSNPSFQLLKVSPMMDHKVNGVRNFSNDLRTNLDLPRTANGDAAGALTDVTDDVLPRRKPPPPPRRSSISNDGPLTDSELQTHHSEASPVDPVYF